MHIDAEFRALIPPLRADELAQLEENLKADGCREPLVVWGDVLLDGHNRYAICTRLGIDYQTTAAVGVATREDAKLWIVHNQLGRRNLSDFVRAELALIAKPIIAARAAERERAGKAIDPVQNSAQGRTVDAIAEIANISRDTVRKVEKIKETAAPELLDVVRQGDVSINAAADVAQLPKARQAEIVARGEREILEAAKKIRVEKAEARRTERVEKINEIAQGNAPLAAVGRKFPVIYCDPPWRYEHVETESRAIENQYPTMSLDEICALPLGEIAHDDAILFMWATSPKLAEAMRVLDAWGFTYRTCAAWDKEVIGMGYYFRQQHELLLVATRGELPTPLPANRPSSVIRARREEHSAKPDMVYELIEAMYPEFDKVEMFARRAREGWHAWGNQSKAA